MVSLQLKTFTSFHNYKTGDFSIIRIIYIYKKARCKRTKNIMHIMVTKWPPFYHRGGFIYYYNICCLDFARRLLHLLGFIWNCNEFVWGANISVFAGFCISGISSVASVLSMQTN